MLWNINSYVKLNIRTGHIASIFEVEDLLNSIPHYNTPGVLKFELGTDVRPKVSTATLKLKQGRRKFATYV